MSAIGIIPDAGYGGLAVDSLPAPAGVTSAYVPPSSFTISTQLRFYGALCSANRYDPQQLNAFQSEMIALAARINPNGTWNASSVTNLANAFTNWATGLETSGVSLATAAEYPGAATSDISAATPAYVAAAVAASFTSPLAITNAAAYPSSNDTKGITAAYLSASQAAALATSSTYPSLVASETRTATPAYVSAAISAATTTIEALIPNRAAASNYPSASDTAYTTPAYVTAAIAAIAAGLTLTHSAAYPSASDTTAASPAYVTAAISAASVPSRTAAAAYPSASDTTYATPAYVTAAIAAIGAGLSLTHSAAYPSSSDTTAASPAYVTAAIAGAAHGAFSGLTDVLVTTPQNNQLSAYNSGASKWENIDAPYNLGIYAQGVLANSENVLVHVFPYAVEIASGAPASYAKAQVAATGSTTLTLKKNGSSIGTIIWSASGTTGAFTFSTNQTFAAGDVLLIAAPASTDATLADIAITLAGFRI